VRGLQQRAKALLGVGGTFEHFELGVGS
jgi:hypothetical protein